MKRQTAHCSCGKVSAACLGDPVSVSLCHCIECQRRTGGPYGIAAFFEKSCVDVSGETTQYTRSSDSGYSITFHFCPNCGSTVFWYPERMPERTAVAVGAFGDPSFPEPMKSVYDEHRHHWVEQQIRPDRIGKTGPFIRT